VGAVDDHHPLLLIGDQEVIEATLHSVGLY
jgi:hypothetical protein